MIDESQGMADMNWRLVEDANEAIERKDYMLALSLFEQSRRICINEGWRDGVHYADDKILDIYPLVKRQIDESTRRTGEKRAHEGVDAETSTRTLPHNQPLFNAGASIDDDASAEGTLIKPSQTRLLEDTDAKRGSLFEDPSNRRLRRMLDDGKHA